MAIHHQNFVAVSWNVNGLRTRSKLLRVRAALKTLSPSPDLVAFQETHGDEYWKGRYQRAFSEYHVFVSHGNSNSRGVALLVKKSVMFNLKQTLIDPQGRYILLKGQLNSTFFTFGSIYAPSDSAQKRHLFFSKLLELNVGPNHLLLGDFNAVASYRLDRNRVQDQDTTRGDQEFLDFLEHSDSLDAWRYMHPNIRNGRSHHSYARHRTRGPFSRIDHALLTKGLLSQVNMACFVSDFKASDHHLLTLSFDIGPRLIGSDFKKIKPHIFESTHFQNKFQALWSSTLLQFKDTLYQKITQGSVTMDSVFNDAGEVDFSSPFVLNHLDLDHNWWQQFKDKIIAIGFQVQRFISRELNKDARILLKKLNKKQVQYSRTNKLYSCYDI